MAFEVCHLEDAFTIEGPLSAFMQPGFEAPTYGEDGSPNGCVRIVAVDRATNTIYLESVPNGIR